MRGRPVESRRAGDSKSVSVWLKKSRGAVWECVCVLGGGAAADHTALTLNRCDGGFYYRKLLWWRSGDEALPADRIWIRSDDCGWSLNTKSSFLKECGSGVMKNYHNWLAPDKLPALLNATLIMSYWFNGSYIHFSPFQLEPRRSGLNRRSQE